MAEIRVRAVNGHEAQTLTDLQAQLAFLERQGLGLEQWPIERLNVEASKAAANEQSYILDTFSPELERLKADKGYKTADVVALYPTTPNLDAMLAKFDKEHWHDDDEVRFVVAGRGIFTIHSQKDDAVFDVEVGPGDLLIVPQGTWHWFDLCEDKTIKCIRLFRDAAAWVPHYVQS